MRTGGFTLLELLVIMAITVVTAAALTPDALRLTSALRVRTAAAEVAGALRFARGLAVRSGEHVAVRFRVDDEGAVSFAVYRDGDGDGVLNSDIATGVDPLEGPVRKIRHLGHGVRFGFPPGPAPRDPANPRRFLDRLEDPIRFNRSDLASFNPLGGSTPGSVYLTDGRDHLTVVRLYGITGKLKAMNYDRLREEWH